MLLDRSIGLKRYIESHETYSSTKYVSVNPGSTLFAPEEGKFEEFQEKIAREFIEGSAIAPELFRAAIEFLTDIEVGAGGDVTTPIHDALGWHYTRFGHQVKPTLSGAFFQQETGETWQIKLCQPRQVKDEGKYKVVRYETPKGTGSKAYLPPVNRETLRAIAERYGCDIPPPSESFWDWLEQHPEIEILLTEGGKKGLCLLSQGYVAIALTGVNGGYRAKDENGVELLQKQLIPYLQRFCQPGRRFILAFDSDDKESTRSKVWGATITTANLLEKATGKRPLVVRWDGKKGKGVDDLIVNCGLEAWKEALAKAKTTYQWNIFDREKRKFKGYAGFVVNVPDLSEGIDAETIPTEGVVAIRSDKGTGKTKLLEKIAAARFVKIGHRQSLERNAANRLNGYFINDSDRVDGRPITADGYLDEATARRVTLCFDSLLRVKVSDVIGGDLILDEVVQGIRHMLTSGTCRKKGKRAAIQRRLAELVKAANRVIVLDADLDSLVLDYICKLRGVAPAMVLDNKLVRDRSECRFYETPNENPAIADLLADVDAGLKPFIVTDTLAKAEVLSELLGSIIGQDAIFQFNSRTSGSKEGMEFVANPDAFFANNPHYKAAIVSPSGFTGLSLESDCFEIVYGFFYGQSCHPDDCLQGLERVRANVPCVVWSRSYGSSTSSISGFANADKMHEALKKKTRLTRQLINGELSEETANLIDRYDADTDPHAVLLTAFEADRNFAMSNFRDCLLVKLELSGYQLERVTEIDEDEETKAKLKAATSSAKNKRLARIATAKTLSQFEAKALRDKGSLNQNEQDALEKYAIADFYGIDGDAITTEDVDFDKKGRTRTAINRLLDSLVPNLAAQKDVQAMQLHSSSAGVAPQDLTHREAARMAWEMLGFTNFLDNIALEGKSWSKDSPEVQAIGARCRECADDIRTYLGFSCHKMDNVQIVNTILRRMALRPNSRQIRNGEERIRVYQIDREALQRLVPVLVRQAEIQSPEGVDAVTPILLRLHIGIGVTKGTEENNGPPDIPKPPDCMGEVA